MEIRKCKNCDLPQINKIRMMFPLGNGGALKYMKCVDTNEIIGVFDDQDLVGLGRVSTQKNFYYYEQCADCLKLSVKHNVAIASSTFILPEFRHGIGAILVRRMGEECRRKAPFGLFELRALMPMGKNRFWEHYLRQYLGTFNYQEFIKQCLIEGEEKIVEKLPQVIEHPDCLGVPHRHAQFVKKIYERKGYRQFGLSYSTGTALIGKDFS